MREIKFRGKSLNTGEWVKGYYLVNRGEHYIAPDEFVNPLAKPSDYEVDPDTVGQYRELKDSEGREIYDGDILSENGNIIGVVVWSARYGVSIRKKNTTWALINFCLDSDFGCGTLSNIEVIGNIHDNPELLER